MAKAVRCKKCKAINSFEVDCVANVTVTESGGLTFDPKTVDTLDGSLVRCIECDHQTTGDYSEVAEVIEVSG